MGSYRSYVEPLLDSAPIRVLTYAPANRVLLKGERAVGVEVERFGHIFHFRCSWQMVVPREEFEHTWIRVGK